LDDVFRNTNVVINQLYLIDNSPTNQLEKLSKQNTKICYKNLPKNIGYGAAHNIAIAESIKNNISYHLVLNPDIRFHDSVLDKLTKYMDKNTDVGLVMPDIHYPDGSRQHLCKLLPNPLVLIIRRFLPRFISQKFNLNYNLLNLDYSKDINVPVLSGCFMFLRTSVLDDVGIFDQRYFMYLEDVDLSRRIHVKYKTIFSPIVTVIHEYNKESYRSIRLLWIHISSACSYFNKYGWVFDSERNKINSTFLKKYL
jgi:GT2 family glycosyltransferase